MRLFSLSASVCGLIFLFSPSSYGQTYTTEQTPLYSTGLQAPRTEFLSYRKARYAMANSADSSAGYSSLKGEWAFKYFDDGSKITDNLYQRHVELKSWDKITLPLGVNLTGSGEAVFSQSAYPFATSAPKAPRLNSQPWLPETSAAAIFATDFVVPFDYTDKALYLYIGGGASRMTIYVNGEQVGVNMMSDTGAEIDISKSVQRGLNRLAIRVDRFSAASYIEDQSGWRLWGLTREIYLFAQPKIRMRDFLTRTTLDPTYTNGLLEAAMLIKSELLNPHTVTVYYDLYDPQGQIISQNKRDISLDMRREDTVRFTASVYGVRKWTAENPQLYTIMYRIQREGRFTEYVTRKVGFRSSEVKGDKYLFNGEPLIFKGVVWDVFDSKTGNAVDEKQLRFQIENIRMRGFNAIRTVRPMPELFYALCDEIGLYVVDVAGLNSSGLSSNTRLGGTLANNPSWCDAFVERVLATYERAKNHTSVVMWALGSQAGNGYNMYQAFIALKARDTTRPVVYDGAGEQWNTQILCPLNPDSEQMISKNGMPVIPFAVPFDKNFWAAGSQGAFLEGYQDLSLESGMAKKSILEDNYKLTKGNVNYKNLGVGDFFYDVLITPVDATKGLYRFENRMQFSNLSEQQVSYQLFNGSKLVKEGALNVDAAPGHSVEVIIPNAGAKHGVEIKIGKVAFYSNRVIL
ncbi:MAG: glycoside hydrolase family 2 TIM barrel-domain containing protein [Mucinivorans sp.]